MNTAAIVTKNLTKRYHDVTAVENLDLRVNEGELFALLGVNGAGKTTTMKMLTCLVKPTRGDAEILGESVREFQHEIKEEINISPQETAIGENLSVKENLELIARLYGQSRQRALQNATRVAERLGLVDVMRKRARHLSGGMRRRLSIAMSLISDPRILFLDEPTLGLDVLARRELWDIVQNLKGKVTIVLTTHYLEEAQALSDRVGILIGGQLRAVGTSAELMARTGTGTLEEAFVSLAEGSSGKGEREGGCR
jgi:ABC-2 type transport system ATP-binding protein